MDVLALHLNFPLRLQNRANYRRQLRNISFCHVNRIVPINKASTCTLRKLFLVRCCAEETKLSTSTINASLDMLEWDRLCSLVAKFASTAAGKRKAKNLVQSRDQHEAETLLAETRAALAMETSAGGSLQFGGMSSDRVEEGIAMLRKYLPIGGTQAAAIASFMTGANGLRRTVLSAMANGTDAQKKELALLGDLLRPMVTGPDVVKSIWSIVNEDGSVRDEASPELKRARIGQRTIEMRLQDLMARYSAKGQVANISGRYCILVPSDLKDTVPGLLLQSAQGGSYAYIEPFGAVSLNNQLANCRSESSSAEQAVLAALGSKLREHTDDFQFVLDTVTRLDEIMARARFGSWLGGIQPAFVSLEADAGQEQLAYDPLLDLTRLRHPLLLTQHRDIIKGLQEKVGAKLKALKLARRRGEEKVLALAEREWAEASSELDELTKNPPVPIDVRISRETRAVTITGPNTGGKTAAIKAVGLALLMAKSGLFVVATDAMVPWVDHVLADIGDQQSLVQSLSTFSGHLERIQGILSTATPSSVVLLDEVGGGTDPTQGAALGMALLESLADGRCLLTLATTHHGELKTLKYRDSRFENASVEFDEMRLVPTYRLLWGVPGRSNAVNIAQKLGLPAAIVEEARALQGTASAEVNEVIMAMEKGRLSYEESTQAIERLRRETEEMRVKLEEFYAKIRSHRMKLLVKRGDVVAAAAEESYSRMRAIMARDREEKRLMREAAIAAPKGPQVSGSLGLKRGDVGEASEDAICDADGSNCWVPLVGQAVSVPKLGAIATISTVNQSKKVVTAQLGSMKVTLKWSELEPADKDPKLVKRKKSSINRY